VAKTEVTCVKFFPDVVCKKLLKLANAAWSYSKNKSGSFFMDHGVVVVIVAVVVDVIVVLVVTRCRSCMSWCVSGNLFPTHCLTSRRDLLHFSSFMNKVLPFVLYFKCRVFWSHNVKHVTYDPEVLGLTPGRVAIMCYYPDG